MQGIVVRHIQALFAAMIWVLVLAGSAAHADDKSIRLAVVNTPKMSGLIDALAADFEKAGGLHVEITSGSDVYERARAGEADLIISHYGKPEVERFVLDGFGLWPRMVFSNQLVIAGHKSDPAGIKGTTSASQAFGRIAAAKAPFVANDLPGVDYLTEILWHGAGEPPKGEWYLAHQASKGRAVGLAEDKKGYVIWGALPFLRYLDKHSSEMEIMVSNDPVLQRVMAAIVVNPAKIAGTNTQGAEAFVKYLLSAKTQAFVANFRSQGVKEQLWWPIARSNATEGLDE